MPKQWYWDTFYWIFVIVTEIFKNGSLIYRNGRAANRLYKRYFSATGGRITCMYFNCSVHKLCFKSLTKKNVYIVNVKISVYLTKKLRKYCLKVEYTRNPVRQSMRCYGLFLPSLRSHHYCEVTAVPRIHFSKTSRKWKKNLPQSLMPLWNISRWGMKPTTRTRTRAQNPLSDFLRWPNVTCNNFILDFWAYLYDALHKQCLV